MTTVTATNGKSPSAEEQLPLAENARVVLERRIMAKDGEGNLAETPAQLFRRVAHNLAQAEVLLGADAAHAHQAESQFYRVLTSLDFLPNSPTLTNAGRPLQQLSACFVLPVGDSIQEIFEAIKYTAIIHQSGGGTGFAFSRLRPEGSIVASTAGVASGPVSFMKVFDGATEAIKQGGCVIPSTRVATANGLVQIGSLGPRESNPDTWHPLAEPLTVYTDEGTRRAEEFYHNGRVPVRRLRTVHGYGFTGTQEHRIRVIDEQGDYVWRHLKDIRVGDWAVLQKHTYPEETGFRFPPLERTPHFNATLVAAPEEPSVGLGEFIGYFIGDGCTNYYNEGRSTGRLIVTVAHGEPEIRSWLLQLTASLFHLEPVQQTKPNDASSNYFFNSTELVAWLRHVGVTKTSSLDVRIPEVVFKAGAAFARGFLRGLFSADGTVSTEGYPSLASISRDLVEDVQQLLLAVGIPSSIGVSENRESAFGTNPLYRLRVITREGLKEFAERIGFLSSAKSDRLNAGLQKAWEFNDVIPNQERCLASAYAGPGRGSGPGRSSRGADRARYRDLQHYFPNVVSPRNLTRSRLQTLLEKHEAIRQSPIARFLGHNQFYDQIVEIEDGEADTVDLSVEQNHTYVANGFVSHNTRRGANMGILIVDHPDIEKFIEVKADMTTLTNFNISVAVTDKFMQAVERDEEYDLWDPHLQKVVGHKRARDVWDKLVHNAWKNGDPGLVFIDEINRHNPVPQWGNIESTNPCGEQALGPYDSCNLGSINLANFAVRRSNGWQVDWDRLGSVIPICVRLLDNVIEMNKYPIPEIEQMSKANRRIGLGVMGFADLLMKLGVPYNSEEAVTWAQRIMAFIESRANAASIALGEERGVFPAWEGSVFNTDAGRYPEKPRYRNCTRTTVAPTGTLSIIANCSSGIEPVFALAFMRQHYLDRKDPTKPTQLTEANEQFLEVAHERGFYSEDLMTYLAQGGRLIERAEVPDDVKRVFVTAHDIEPEWHVRIQAAFQRHVDNGVSKTVNFSHEATPADVERAYLLAYHEACKGITIYRDGSRDLQVLSHQGAQKSDMSGEMAAVAVQPLAPEPGPRRERLPDERQSMTHKFTVGDQEGYLTVGLYDDGRPGEVFIKVSKQGSTVSGLMDTIAQLTSIALQYGVPLETLVEKLKGSRFEPAGMTSHPELRTATSLADYIFRYLEYKYVDGGESNHKQLPLWGDKVEMVDLVPAQSGMGCPECGSLLHFAEGCLICRTCGFSRCG